jgi:serine/threonine protein kinase
MPVRVANQSEPIPGYKLIERLGRGGFGEVWKAEAPGGLHKAIKFVYGEVEGSKGGVIAADQELKALNRVKTVRHPYLLSLERVDIIDGQLIIVMELADCNLLERFKECHKQGLPGIPRDELLRYMEESAEALDLMNVEFQLQHLDIKPQNLFLVRNHIKVADFGLCKDLEGFRATVTGGVTPLYAAPETFEGWVSRYCDQYSLAIVYQELLTGQRPFDGTNARQLLMQHVQMPPDLSPLPEGDRPVIGRALSKKPQERFPTCLEMVQALRAAGGEVTQRSPVPPSAAATPQRRDTPENVDAGNGGMFALPSKSSEEITRNILPAGSRPAAREEIKKSRVSYHGVAKTPKPTFPEAGAADLDTSMRPIALSAPIEFRGEGVLFPALVIGLGGVGQTVLGNLRQALCERFGSLEHLPHLRLLYVDSDAENVQNSVHGGQPASLDPGDVLLTRLHRPSHYMNPRSVHTEGGQPLIATWLDLQMLYRISRNQTTGGVRTLGRLALLDNYPEVNERIVNELRAATETEALSVADRHTKLGLRVNRPRVYVITALGGGTGSGMFMDVAYAARNTLRRLGYERPEVVGLFFLPTAEAPQAKTMALGNAHAALRELHHFSSPGVTYTVRHAAKEPSVTDSGAPFVRCTFLPEEGEDDATRDMPGVAAGFLFRDIMSPLGRLADDRRTASRKETVELKPGAKVLPVCHTFGMFRLSWPRRLLVERAARRIGLRLVQHWVAKDTAGLRGEVEKWVKEQWGKRQLQVDHLISCLRAATEGALDAEPEEAFAALLEPMEKDRASWNTNPDPARARQILAETEKLVGRPDGVASPQPPRLKEGLEVAARTLLANCEQKVAEMAVELVEQPNFRFAGADEAINQMEQLIRQTIEQQEHLTKDFAGKANEAYQRITGTLDAMRAALASKRKLPPGTGEIPDLLRLYPMLRFKGLMLQHILTVYRSLLGNCPEYMREFTYCRTRLTDLLKTFEKLPPSATSANLGSVRQLLPGGCRSLDDAVNKLVDSVNRNELLEIDKRVQTAIQQQLKAMVHICTTPATNILREVEFLMTHELEAYVSARLTATNLLDTFFEQFARDETATAQIGNVYEEAVPTLETRAVAAREHMALLTIPADPAVERFRNLAQQAIPDAELVTVATGDDVIFYRDVTNLKLTDLPQLGAEGQAAYERMCATDHFTAHNRIDVTDWRPLTTQ